MHKPGIKKDASGVPTMPERVLARVLADELHYAKGDGDPTVLTEPNPRRDITNASADIPPSQ